MGTKLSGESRREILALAKKEATILKETADRQAKRHWREAEELLVERQGLTEIVTRIRETKAEIRRLQEELAKLEAEFPWASERPSKEEYETAGLSPPTDRYGYAEKIPKIFGIEIGNKWKLEVFKVLCETIGIDEVWRIVDNVELAIVREISLAGTHEEAQVAYGQFYALISKACGKQVPPLLEEMAESLPKLLVAGSDGAKLSPPSQEQEEAADDGRAAQRSI